MGKQEYSKESVIPLKFPEWREAHGEWQRTWTIVLVHPCPPDVPTVEPPAVIGELRVTAHVDADRRKVSLTTATAADPMLDSIFYGQSYDALRWLEQTLGTIETIEGFPRNAWQPFRER